MFISNLSNYVGEDLGLVTGTYVASRVFYKDFFNSVRNFFGWELKSYSEMNNEAINQAIERMIKEAETLKADAVINVKFAITTLTNDASVVIASGSAIKRKE